MALAAWFALLVCWAVPAVADTKPWKTIGRWDISYYPGAEGCQAFAVFDGDTAFFIGFDGRGPRLMLDVTLLDPHWSEMKAGETYAASVRFGRETPWSVSMAGLVIDSFPGMNFLIDADSEQANRFVSEFQRKSYMEWSHEGGPLGRYPLRGSFRAFQEVRTCQTAFAISIGKSKTLAQ
ncbi:MAG: hypothetical protein AB3N23_08145 [Paracoccaceae bacterium]